MDSLLLTLMGLEKAAKQFNLKTGKTAFDFEKINNAVSPQDFDAFRDDLLHYNMNDCVVL
jgi:hypothetical protein